MNKIYWQQVLPPWPVVPARLWLTGAGAVLALLSLVFRQEIWPGHPQAQQWSGTTLVLLLAAGGIEAMRVLCRWPRAYVGPGWVRLAVRGVAWVAIIGIAILLMFVLLLGCLLLPG